MHEIKYDGYRLLIAVGDGVATAWTRNGMDWSDKFKALVKAAAKLPAGCLIDGEAVALDDEGRPSFQLLQSTLEGRQGANLAFYAFDLLVDRGEDIRKLPNIERKERLAALLEGVSPPILYGDHVIGRGEEMFDAVCKQGGEGHHLEEARARPTAARARATGSRSSASSARNSSSSAGRKATSAAASAHCCSAARDGRKLTYVGKVGTGFNGQLIEDLMERMEPLGDRQGAGRGAARRPQGRALDQAEARRRDRLRRIHRRRHPAPPELHWAARGQAGEGGGARSAASILDEDRASEAARRRRRDAPRTSGSRSAAPTA